MMLLPTTLDRMPRATVFDTVFSMGVLYHRRDPLGHLRELAECLRPGGELVLETLVVEGDPQTRCDADRPLRGHAQCLVHPQHSDAGTLAGPKLCPGDPHG